MPGQGQEAGKLAAHDALRDQLRADYPDRHIYHAPWGWVATNPDVTGPSLEELAEKLENGR